MPVYDIFLTCPYEEAHTLGEVFISQLKEMDANARVLLYGPTDKQGDGFIVLEWYEPIPASLMQQLKSYAEVTDYTLYRVPCVEDERQEGASPEQEQPGGILKQAAGDNTASQQQKGQLTAAIGVYYTVDYGSEGFPVYHRTPGSSKLTTFSGPFEDPVEAALTFCAYWQEYKTARGSAVYQPPDAFNDLYHLTQRKGGAEDSAPHTSETVIQQ